MTQDTCKITDHRRVAPGHYVITLDAPRIARDARPGQFVQILCADSDDPLLPRPFSFLDAGKGKIAILYHVVGKGTAILETAKPGRTLRVLGPLGNGFTMPARVGARHAVPLQPILVGGGVGIPPLYHWAKEAIGRKALKPSAITVLLGARGKQFLLCEKEFRRLGVELRTATDDGSKGRKGFVTELLAEILANVGARSPRPMRGGETPPLQRTIYTCGPTPMMRAVSALAAESGVPCEVSVEVPMACGFGACLGCAVKVKNAQNHRFAIACCEGPVFKGDEILWD